MQPRVRFRFQDKSAKTALLSCWLPSDESLSLTILRANIIRDALVPISNAQLLGADLVYEEFAEWEPGPAGGPVDIRTNLLLFCNNGAGAIDTIRIPSPASALPYDTTGPYAGIRIQRAALAASGLLAPLEAAIALTYYQNGTPFPTLFDVAGVDFAI